MSDSKKKTLLILNGSPIKGSNTDLISRKVAEGAEFAGWTSETIYLNDYIITPCQACGVRDDDDICIYHDDIYFAYEKFGRCDAVVAATPIYFDTVSAQLKLFIDRCNCYRPLKCKSDGSIEMEKRDRKGRTGVAVMVGGERQKHQSALTVIKGFFIWCGVDYLDSIYYATDGNETGTASRDSEILQAAYEMGLKLSQ